MEKKEDGKEGRRDERKIGKMGRKEGKGMQEKRQIGKLFTTKITVVPLQGGLSHCVIY